MLGFESTTEVRADARAVELALQLCLTPDAIKPTGGGEYRVELWTGFGGLIFGAVSTDVPADSLTRIRFSLEMEPPFEMGMMFDGMGGTMDAPEDEPQGVHPMVAEMESMFTTVCQNVMDAVAQNARRLAATGFVPIESTAERTVTGAPAGVVSERLLAAVRGREVDGSIVSHRRVAEGWLTHTFTVTPLSGGCRIKAVSLLEVPVAEAEVGALLASNGNLEAQAEENLARLVQQIGKPQLMLPGPSPRELQG